MLSSVRDTYIMLSERHYLGPTKAAEWNRKYPSGAMVVWSPAGKHPVTGRTTTPAYSLSSGRAMVRIDAHKGGVPLSEVKVQDVEAVAS